MAKVDIWARLAPQTQAAVQKSRELYATFKPEGSDALANMRAGYCHERRHWNSFPVELPSVANLSLQTPQGNLALRLYKPATQAKQIGRASCRERV